MDENTFYHQIPDISDFINSSSSFKELVARRDHFLRRIQNLRFSIEHLEHSIIIALLGGTGVGKSTLINALARGEISASSIIRPLTQNGVFYYHLETTTSVIEHILAADDRTVIHEIPELKHKILVDTPDIDSIISSHRKRTQKILEGSDLVLCIVTPEKYKNQSLFDILKSIVDRRHFIFLFNKIDLGLSDSVLADFTQQLETIGISKPLILKISTGKFDTSEFKFGKMTIRNEFNRLEEIIRNKLSEKRIHEIKKINLKHSINHFIGELKSVMPEDTRSNLQRIKAEYQQTYQHFSREMSRFYMDLLSQFHRDILGRYFESCYLLSFRWVLGVYFAVIDKFKSVFSPHYLSAATHSVDDILVKMKNALGSAKHDPVVEAFNKFTVETRALSLQFFGETEAGAESGIDFDISKFNSIVFEELRRGSLRFFEKYDCHSQPKRRNRLIFIRNILGNLLPWAILIYALFKLFSQYVAGNIPSSDLLLFHLIVFILSLVLLHQGFIRLWFRIKRYRLLKRMALSFQQILANLAQYHFQEPMQKRLQRIEADVDFLAKL
ncbi:50S ribosome-binding GTPase [candidate division KSB1 bacterium]|nr:50S ribosome-binding GTPase [candidate division KSB1 bacterium]